VAFFGTLNLTFMKEATVYFGYVDFN